MRYPSFRSSALSMVVALKWVFSLHICFNSDWLSTSCHDQRYSDPKKIRHALQLSFLYHIQKCRWTQLYIPGFGAPCKYMCVCLKYVQCGTVITWSILTQILTNTPQRASYGVSFANINSDAYFTSVTLVPYARSCNVCRNLKYYRMSNTLRTRKNGRHFAGDIFKHIFSNENCCILIRISLKFVPRDPISRYASVGSDDGLAPTRPKPLSEPMLVRLLTHICVTWPRWVKP